MSFILESLKYNFLNKVKTTKDLIYKDKTIDAFNISKSYRENKEAFLKFDYLEYLDSPYYLNSSSLQHIFDLVYLNDELTQNIKAKWSESLKQMEDFIASEVHNSLWVEGIKSSRRKVTQIVKNTSFDQKDLSAKYISNYQEALNYIFKTEEINEQNLFALHNILTRDLPIEETNRLKTYPYRDDEVEIEKANFEGITFSQIKNAMDSAFRLIKEVKELHKNSKATMHIPLTIVLHYHFEIIHPYFDFNGRMGRLFSLWYAKSLGFLEEFLFFSEAINMFKEDLYYKAFKLSEEKGFKFDVTYFVSSVLCALIGQKVVYDSMKTIELEVKNKYKQKFTSHQKEIVMSLLSKVEFKKIDHFFKSQELILGINEINPGQISTAFSQLVAWGIVEETNTKPKEYKLAFNANIVNHINKLLTKA